MPSERALHDLEVKLWVEQQELAHLSAEASASLRSAIEAAVEELRKRIAEAECECRSQPR